MKWEGMKLGKRRNIAAVVTDLWRHWIGAWQTVYAMLPSNN